MIGLIQKVVVVKSSKNDKNSVATSAIEAITSNRPKTAAAAIVIVAGDRSDTEPVSETRPRGVK